MIDIEFTEDTMLVHLKGLDGALAGRGHLEIPLAHITGVIVHPAAVGETFKRLWAGVRFGTHIPGVLLAGTFYQQSEKNFWDVHHPEHAIIISLIDEEYKKLVIEVKDPQAIANAIESRIKAE